MDLVMVRVMVRVSVMVRLWWGLGIFAVHKIKTLSVGQVLNFG